MRISPTLIAGFSLLLLGVPAAAQQATAPPAASPNPPTAQGPAGMMGGRGPGGMGMMMGSRAMRWGEDEDDDAGPMRGWRHGPEGRGTPMQIIINIGPDNHVETEKHGWGGVGAGPRGRMMGGEWRGRWVMERVGAHLNYLHDQLQLTPEQQPAWDRFASAVRDAVARMRSGLAGVMQGQSLEQKLTGYETMLNSRLEAVRAIRNALSDLTSSLNDTQKQTLDAIQSLPLPLP